jgi:uncharacterized protein (TIGR03067 family)
MEAGRGRHWVELPEAEGGPELLAGRWVVTRVEHGEWAFVPGLPLAGVRDLTFVNGRCSMTVEEKDLGRPPIQGEFAVTFDPAATPKGFDLTRPGSEQPCRGIYRLTSAGKLLLAFGNPLDVRPAGFDPTRHQVTLLVCDRGEP